MEAYTVSLNSVLFSNGHLYMATHINTNTWKQGLENKLLKTNINSSTKHIQL